MTWRSAQRRFILRLFCAPSGRFIGKRDARRLGAWLGMLVRRNGGLAIYLFSAGRRNRMRAGRRRTHLWARAPRDVCAGGRERLRSEFQRPPRERGGALL